MKELFQSVEVEIIEVDFSNVICASCANDMSFSCSTD